MSLPDGYRLLMEPPTVSDYLTLRERAGLHPRTREQAEAGIGGAWAACHVVAEAGTAVAMGRVIGDGGWYFHIIDMAVLPEHQRRGLGTAILEALLDRIRAGAPPGAFVSLLADEPGQPLYARFGFFETTPRYPGMGLRL